MVSRLACSLRLALFKCSSLSCACIMRWELANPIAALHSSTVPLKVRCFKLGRPESLRADTHGLGAALDRLFVPAVEEKARKW